MSDIRVTYSSAFFDLRVFIGPEVVVKVSENGAPYGQDILGAGNMPEHAGLFGTLSDDSFASGLNNTGADKVAMFFEAGVKHAVPVCLEVLNCGKYFFGVFLSSSGYQSYADKFVNLVTLQPLFPKLCLSFCFFFERVKKLSQFRDMLEGVVKVKNLYCVREIDSCNFPDPYCAIAKHDHLLRLCHSSKHSFILNHRAEINRFIKTGDVSGAVRVSLWKLSMLSPELCEYTSKLYFPRSG